MGTDSKTTTRQLRPPGWARLLRRGNDHLMFDLFGGPRPWKLSWLINHLQKAGTFPFLAC
ncbi:MAG: hypothetical protein IPF45_00710 [Thermomonas sp.]|nr:hypothetical protein [Thermomonas sp.]